MSASIATKKKNISMEFLRKTAGYVAGATGEYISDVMPVTGSTISGARDTARELQSTFTTTSANINQKIIGIRKQLTFRKITDWYLQKETDFDIDGDFDSQLDFDIETDQNTIAQAQISEWGKNANQISKTVVESSHKLVEASISSTANLISGIDRQTAVISAGFDRTNTTLNKILEVLTKNTSTMIETMHTSENRLAKDNLMSGKMDSTWFNNYKKIVKGNIGSSEMGVMASMLPMIPSLIQGTDPKDILKMGIGAGVNKFAPKAKKNMKTLDDSIGDVIMGSLLRLGEQQYKGGPKGVLAQLFGIKADRDKGRTKGSSLEMKAVPFDTVAKEAITQAIPGYLRQILIQLGGKDLTYDFRSRQFKSSGSIKRQFQDNVVGIGLSDSWNSGRNLKKHTGNMTDNDRMLFDMMVADMGWSNNGTGGVEKARGLDGMSKQQLTKYLHDLSKSLQGKVDIGNMLEIMTSVAGDRLAVNDIVNIVSKENLNRNQRVAEVTHRASIMGDRLDNVKDGLEGDIEAITRNYGRRAKSEVNLKQSTGPTGGMEYANRALYAIYSRLQMGLNVYQTGAGEHRDKPYPRFQKNWLPVPSGIREMKDENREVIANKAISNFMNTGKAQPVVGVDGEPVGPGKALAERGKDLGKAILFGNKEDVQSAFGSLMSDTTSQIGGFLKTKLLGREDVQNVIGKGKGILSDFTDGVEDFFKGKKGKGGTQAPNLFDFIFKGKRSDDPEDDTKRKKITGAIAGTLVTSGLGILTGPVGLLLGGLAGSAVTTSGMGKKIHTMIMGDGDKKKGAVGRIGGFFKKMLGYDKPMSEDAKEKRKKTQLLGALGGFMVGSHLGLIGGPVMMILAGLTGAAVSTSGLGDKITDLVLGKKGTTGRRYGGFVSTMKKAGDLILTPFKLLGKGISGTLKAGKKIILDPILNIGKGFHYFFFGNKKTKMPGLVQNVFNNTIGLVFKEGKNVLKDTFTIISRKIMDPIDDLLYTMKQKFKYGISDLFIGRKGKDGKRSGGIFSGFANHMSKAGKDLKDGIGAAFKTILGAPFALLRMLNPFRKDEEGNRIKVFSRDNLKRAGDKFSGIGTAFKRGGITGGLKRLSRGISSVGREGFDTSSGNFGADHIAGDDDRLIHDLEQHRLSRKDRRKDTAPGTIVESFGSLIEITEEEAKLNKQRAEEQRNHESKMDELAGRGMTPGSIYTHDTHLEERDEKKIDLLQSILNCLSGGKETINIPTGTVNQSKITGEDTGSDNVISANIIGAMGTIGAGNGSISKREESESMKAANELKKEEPNKVSVIEHFKQMVRLNRENSEGKGGEPENPLKKLMGKIGDLLGPIGSLATFGIRNPLVAGIAGILGISEGRSFWDNVVDGEKSLKDWWNNDSILGQGIGGMMDISNFIGDNVGPIVDKMSEAISFVTDKIPGLPKISPPPTSSAGPFRGLATAVLGGLYLKAGSAIGSLLGAGASVISSGINLATDILPSVAGGGKGGLFKAARKAIPGVATAAALGGSAYLLATGGAKHENTDAAGNEIQNITTNDAMYGTSLKRIGHTMSGALGKDGRPVGGGKFFGKFDASGNPLSKPIKSPVSSVAGAADDVAKTSGGAIGWVKKGLAAIKKHLTDNSKIKKIAGAVSKINTKIDEILSLVVKSGQDIFKKSVNKVASIITRGTVKDVGGAATAGIGYAVFGLAGAVSGSVSASHIFGIRKQDVTKGMETAASIIVAMLNGVPIAWTLELLDLILQPMLGITVRSFFAELLYTIFNKEDGAAHLSEARDEMERNRASYNERFDKELTTQEFNDMTAGNTKFFNKLWKGSSKTDGNGDYLFDDNGEIARTGGIHGFGKGIADGVGSLFGKKKSDKSDDVPKGAQLNASIRDASGNSILDGEGKIIKKDGIGNKIGSTLGSLGESLLYPILTVEKFLKKWKRDQYETDEKGEYLLDSNGKKIPKGKIGDSLKETIGGLFGLVNSVFTGINQGTPNSSNNHTVNTTSSMTSSNSSGMVWYKPWTWFGKGGGDWKITPNAGGTTLEDWEYQKSTQSDISKGNDKLPSPFIGNGMKVTSPYGTRSDPITGKSSFHSGIDLIPTGGNWEIGAIMPGTIKSVGDMNDGFGNTVRYQTDDGVEVLNAHMASNSNSHLKSGDRVVPGDTLGKMGSTGRSTGNHLHLEFRNHNPSAIKDTRGGNTFDPGPLIGTSTIANTGNYTIGSQISNDTFNSDTNLDGSSTEGTTKEEGPLSVVLNSLKGIGSRIMKHIFGGLSPFGEDDVKQSGFGVNGDGSYTGAGAGFIDGPVIMIKSADKTKYQSTGDTFEILDLNSGQSWEVVGMFNTNTINYHTDWTPKTPNDTAIIKGILTSEGKDWEWTPRPAIAKIGKSEKSMVAVGIHFRPHAGLIGGNPGPPLKRSTDPNYKELGGHMCMWFGDSYSMAHGGVPPGLKNGKPDMSNCNGAAYLALEMGNKMFASQKQSGVTAGQVSGNDRETKAWNFFASKGLSSAAVAGIMGTLKKETEADPLNPTFHEKGGPGRGIFQWTHGSDRWRGLNAYARSKNKSWDDLQTQLEYSWMEMAGETDDKFNHRCFEKNYAQKYDSIKKNYQVKEANYISDWNAYTRMNDVDQAARVFDAAFTRSPDSIANGRMIKRAGFAKDYLSRFGSGGSKDPVSPTLNNSSLSSSNVDRRGVGGPLIPMGESGNIRTVPSRALSTSKIVRPSASPIIPANIPKSMQRNTNNGSGFNIPLNPLHKTENIFDSVTADKNSEIRVYLDLILRELQLITGNTSISSEHLDVISRKEFGVDEGLRSGISQLAKSHRRRTPFPTNEGETRSIQRMIRPS